MAVPNATITKNIALAPDGWKRTAFPDGSVPNAGPTAPPAFTTSKTSSSITATITNANGATSYNVRVNAGAAVAGLTVSGLTAETAYSFQVQGVNEFGSSDWSTAVNVTTNAAPSGSWTEGVAPSISGVSGSFIAGQTATLTVSNLSTKRNGQLAFIDFENETLGASVTSVAQDGTGAEYVASNSSGLFGTRYAHCLATQQSLGSAAVLLGQEYTEIFFEGWGRYSTPDFTDPEDAQVKFWRLVPGIYLGENAQARNPSVAFLYEDGNGFIVGAYPEEYIVGSWYGGGPPPQDTWDPWTLYYKIGDPNIANGKRYAKVGPKDTFTYSPPGHFASPNDVVAASEWDGEGVITNDGALEGGIGRVFLPYYTRNGQTTTSDVDRIFVNDSPERVVVGDASTWAACDRRKTFILKQLSRTGSEVVVNVDTLGPLATGPAYLYVFNQDGLYNSNGYLWRAA